MCIDLIFTTQPNLVVESGVHPSLHANCHHQLAFVKFNLQIFYPPPYPREIWHYKQANSELVRQAISNSNWDRAFLNTNVNKKVSTFTSTVMNKLSNFIPHETIVCDDKDPPWFNKLTKFHKSSKAYWSLLKTFLNIRKIPVIPPLCHEGNFVTNFKKKANLFNSFFASQCSLIKNDSKLPFI